MTASVGGVLSGLNPFIYSSSSPLTLFLFQACLILAVCNLVHIPFKKIRQPKVISEVLAGVILGPTVLGQIPNYTNSVFPSESIPGLNLTANLGIILFMFFLGLEVDIAFIKKHLRTALTIGIFTLAVPFGCGCLIAIPLFNNYANKDPSARNIKFTVYMIFIAVSISVTAFPVLCRILNELRLIKDRAGVVVLGAGLINDILGWILLALSVILSASESNPVNTVYILLLTFGWFLIYIYPVRYILRWALIKTNELDRSKPSPFATMCILFIMFISAYFTDIIGVHAIFGAFIAGLVVPRDNNYVVKLVERMEDIPNIVLIPIYFAVSGLNVDLTLLNEGKDWGFVFATIAIAITSKIFSGAIMGKLNGLFWRESLAVGILMSCKGIVEIVVLTVGLNAGIISKKIFGMFILMALVSTFVTTPLTIITFPDSYRKKIKEQIDEKDEEIDMSSIDSIITESVKSLSKLQNFEDLKTFQITEIVNIVNATEDISSTLELLNYLNLGYQKPKTNVSHSSKGHITRVSTTSTIKTSSKFRKLTRRWTNHNGSDADTLLAVIEESPSGIESCIPLKSIHLRLLTERTTDLLQSSTLYDDDPYIIARSDPTLQIFSIFSKIGKVPFSSDVIFSTTREKATNINSINVFPTDLILIPLKGAMCDTNVPTLPQDDIYKSFDQLYSHILSTNELPSHFFSQLTETKANMSLLISNFGKPFHHEKGIGRKSFNLLLPNPNLSSSDFLAIYLMLLINYRAQRNGYLINTAIFFNEKNVHFIDNLTDHLSDQSWFDPTSIDTIAINTDHKNENTVSSLPFIDAVLNSMKNEIDAGLDENIFIIAESYFSGEDLFSDEVKNVILQGSHNNFDILITHHYNSC